MEDIKNLKNISVKNFLETECGCNFIKRGSSWFCLSPLRAESNPSFSVNMDENLWYDFGVGEGGDIIKLVQRLENCSFVEAVRILQNYMNYETPKPHIINATNENKWDVYSFYQNIFKNSDQLLIRRFFKEMGLPFHTEIGIAEYADKKRGQKFIVIPCPNKKNIIGLECIGITTINGTVKLSINQNGKIRKTLGKKYPWVFYETKTALIAESIIDCLAGKVIFNNELTLISLNGVGNVKYLPEVLEEYKIEHVLLGLDNDEAGQYATQKAIEIIPSYIEIHIIKDHIKNATKDLYKYLTLLRKKEAKNVSRVS